VVAAIELGEVKFVVDQIVEGVLEGAGQQLSFKIDGDEPGAGVDMLVARHAGSLSCRIGALLFHLVHSKMRR
jgi:hypothetical protein